MDFVILIPDRLGPTLDQLILEGYGFAMRILVCHVKWGWCILSLCLFWKMYINLHHSQAFKHSLYIADPKLYFPISVLYEFKISVCRIVSWSLLLNFQILFLVLNMVVPLFSPLWNSLLITLRSPWSSSFPLQASFIYFLWQLCLQNASRVYPLLTYAISTYFWHFWVRNSWTPAQERSFQIKKTKNKGK